MTMMVEVVGYAINGGVFCCRCCSADEGGDPIFAGEKFDESVFCEDCGDPVVEVDDGMHEVEVRKIVSTPGLLQLKGEAFEVSVLKTSYSFGTIKVKADSFREAEQKVRELIRLGNLPLDSPEIKWEAVTEERIELDPTL